jgi:sterol desaturase/sphingolipid hydroxylase (fatty acid hydroxylase superfamily)
MDFKEFILAYEPYIRSGFFFGILIIMASWEYLAPRRVLTVSKPIRWINNIALVFLNSFVVRLVLQIAAVGIATFAEKNGWGIFNYFDFPFWAAALISIIAMDFIIYLQHVMVHAIPTLWRLHRVHHADLDFDVTTGSRFHPLEIILSMLIKFATIIVLGPPVVAVIMFEIILNMTAMFNHSNVKLPIGFDRVLRFVLVTPDMHRVHHSVEDDEANSNFGFSLPWWDRLFGTYRDQPRGGHENMIIGIHKIRDMKQVSWLPGMLMIPFKGKVSGYAINRREWSNNDEK